MSRKPDKAFIVYNPWGHPLLGTTAYLARMARHNAERLWARPGGDNAEWSDLLRRGYRVHKVLIQRVSP